MSSPTAQPRAGGPKIDLPFAPSMVSKRNENDGVIPRWLFPSVLTIAVFMLAQTFGFGWWAATLTERLSNYKQSVYEQSGLFKEEIEKEKRERQKQIDDLNQKFELIRLEQHVLQVKLAEKGYKVK